MSSLSSPFACSFTSPSCLSLSVDISLDRGKAWLYRNDAGDVFVDESIGKEEAANKKEKSEQEKQQDDKEKQETNSAIKAEHEDGKSAEVTPVPTIPAEPSWVTVSHRLHRAQHQLLYKHLYNALMSEAREWRIASRREQQAKSASHSSSHASSSGVQQSAAPVPAAAAFTPPPSAHSSRPWSITDITPRQITLQIAGAKDGLTLSWNRGIGVAFEIHDANDTEGTTEATPAVHTLPVHISRLVCIQSLSILLDQTLKNSLGNRPLLEVLQTAAINGESAFNRDPTVASTGVGGTGTSQEEMWPARAVSIIQFIVMAITHWRLVQELRHALRQMQQRHEASRQTEAPLTPFRIKPARTTQPYVYAFTVLSGKRSATRA